MLNGQRVLIVEDEFMIASDLADAVQARGGEVVGPVASVSEARPLLERCDAGILDCRLTDGLSIPLALHLLSRGCRVVFHTGHLEHDAVPAGASLVHKPADPQEVVARLAELLRRAPTGSRPAHRPGARHAAPRRTASASLPASLR